MQDVITVDIEVTDLRTIDLDVNVIEYGHLQRCLRDL